ncbi:MAG TPA: hypothetical protein VGH76_08220 [Actinomycetospora sp.]|jgi:hypothetical protein|uniref:PDC sensor domain-containing protein n=1 Tax=Actinomycetospora sp. TaxID=1872135 RepID=UPI002F3F7CFF
MNADAAGARAAAVALAQSVHEVVERLFADLEPLRVAVEDLYVALPRPRAADLAQLRDVIGTTLAAAPDLVVGAGHVPAGDALADRTRWLEWWTVTSGPPPRRLLPDAGPSEEHLDYTRQPWFTVPARTGARHVTGPYVDYFCTDDYTLTLTVPVRREGRFVGVVGSDVSVANVERLVLPRLRALGPRAALVNDRGRVVVSTSVREATGSIVRSPDVAASWHDDDGPVIRCGDFPLGVLRTREHFPGS